MEQQQLKFSEFILYFIIQTECACAVCTKTLILDKGNYGKACLVPSEWTQRHVCTSMELVCEVC